MNIKIDSILFTDEKNFPVIERILHFFIDRRYDLFLDEEEVFESDWQIEARYQYKELIYESFVRTVQNSISYDILISNENDIINRTFSLEDGYTYLNNPTLIFLENAPNDGNFILGLLTKFKSKGRKALRFYNSGWITFVNCGGKNDIINQLNSYLNFNDNRKLDNHHYIKALVVIDSDKKSPNDIIDINNTITDFCEKNSISLHILEKREIENYLPPELLDDTDGVDPQKLESYKSLSCIQKDFYDLEKGFGLDSKNKLRDPYLELTSEQFKILNTGFSPNFNTKIEIPKLFLSESLTRLMLLDRCKNQINPNELGLIIDKINELL